MDTFSYAQGQHGVKVTPAYSTFKQILIKVLTKEAPDYQDDPIRCSCRCLRIDCHE